MEIRLNLRQNHLGQLSLLEDSLKVLGSENLSVLYHHLERFGVRREEIMDKPTEFSNALRTIFGQAASILERQIVSSIASEMGQVHDSDITLCEALKQLKEHGPPGSA